MLNNPDEWHVPFAEGIVGVHPTYPIDGRETLWPAYEHYADTSTVGGFLRALERVQGRDAGLPLDFGVYLAQRVPSIAHLKELPEILTIDPYGATPR